jgi:hypothetical protein
MYHIINKAFKHYTVSLNIMEATILHFKNMQKNANIQVPTVIPLAYRTGWVDLYNDVFNCSYYTASNSGITLIKWKGYGRKCWWPVVRFCCRICLKCHKIHIKPLDSQPEVLATVMAAPCVSLEKCAFFFFCNKAALWNSYLSFYMLLIINKPLKIGMCSLVQNWILNIPTSLLWLTFCV